jgi:dTDP-4-amino-4,6-dideoxygalactose transaminase
VGPGDTVLTTANAGFYSSAATYATGAIPIYVDVDPETFTMSPAALARALPLRPKAVVVTHLYGRLAAIEEIVALSAAVGASVIEDCAQAHGASRTGRRAGSFGTFGCFSFYPTKNLGAAGDGGALVTNDNDLADRARRLRQYGWATKYEVGLHGGRNSRLDEVQAAVLNDKLPHLDAWNAERRDIARQYVKGLRTLPLRLPPSLREEYVAHLFVVATTHRDSLRAHLAAEGIGSEIHFPIPDHLQPISRGANVLADVPVSEAACQTVLSLPCFPGIVQLEIDRIIGAVARYFRGAVA